MKKLLHLTFWGIYTWLTVDYFKSWGPLEKVLQYTAGYMGILMAVFYVHYLYLFPNYLLTKRYQTYSWMLSTFLMGMLVSKIHLDVYFLTEQPVWAYSFGHYAASFFSFFWLLLLSATMRLMEAWMQSQKYVDEAPRGQLAGQKRADNVVQSEIPVANADGKGLMESEPVAAQAYIFVKSNGRLVKVSFEDICYVEGLKEYVSIYTTTERIISLMALKNLENVLPAEQFVRIHKSYIIAVNKITAIGGSAVQINEREIPIGKTYRASIMAVLKPT